jgi:hypothetical protein
VRRRAAFGAALLTTLLTTALLAASARPAHASRYLRVGLYDDASSLFGGSAAYGVMQQLHVQELRITLSWGGTNGVAKTRPASPDDPADPAYDWSMYDEAVRQAAQAGIHVMFSILWTPRWANGGKAPNTAPKKATDLEAFAVAAATRYSGSYVANGATLPAVRDWTAWNEPNNPVFLRPQYRRVGKKWKVQSAIDYARICNAVYTGIHSLPYSSERVACGVTAPRGNNNPSSSRPSVAPIAFLTAAKKAGLKNFDAWAHNPYYSRPTETPESKPVTSNGAAPTAVILGNLPVLIRQVTHLYGNKRIWITEYGYQTKPPDPILGVSYARQAAYLTDAFDIARRNRHIDVMLWFLLQDEPRLSGWQSGLLTTAGKQKPAFAAFAALGAG